MRKILSIVAISMAALSPAVAFADSSFDDGIARERPASTADFGNPFKSIVDAMQKRAAKGTAPFSYTREYLDTLPAAKGDEQWSCLSEALYFEARGESVRGQFAVAEVIMNRVDSGRFPDTLCGVIRQGTGRKYQCQFTYTCDGYKDIIAEKQAYERVSKVARAVMDGVGEQLTDGATHYHTTAVRPSWSRVYTKTARIGVHIFYRHNYRTASND